MAKSKGITVKHAIDGLSVVSLLHFLDGLVAVESDRSHESAPLAVQVDDLQAGLRGLLHELFAVGVAPRKKRVQKFQPTPLALAPLVEADNG